MLSSGELVRPGSSIANLERFVSEIIEVEGWHEDYQRAMRRWVMGAR